MPGVNLSLMSFVETQILPRYTTFGAAHGLSHVQRVIDESVRLARAVGANVDMAYTVAAYHDIGMSGPRAIHHITGAKIMLRDERLKQWFSNEQIRVMSEAVEDHRASASHMPRSIYGRIVAEADRQLDPDSVFTRAIIFGLGQALKKLPPDTPLNKEAIREQQWERFHTHMREKYSENGYLRLWIPNSANEKKLRRLREIINDRRELRKRFERLYAAVKV